MHNRIGFPVRNDSLDSRSIGDVGSAELIAGRVGHSLEGFKIAGIGETVDIQHISVSVIDQMPYNRTANKTGTTRDHYSFSIHPVTLH
jgi:hypothetical protein